MPRSRVPFPAAPANFPRVSFGCRLRFSRDFSRRCHETFPRDFFATASRLFPKCTFPQLFHFSTVSTTSPGCATFSPLIMWKKRSVPPAPRRQVLLAFRVRIRQVFAAFPFPLREGKCFFRALPAVNPPKTLPFTPGKTATAVQTLSFLSHHTSVKTSEGTEPQIKF